MSGPIGRASSSPRGTDRFRSNLGIYLKDLASHRAGATLTPEVPTCATKPTDPLTPFGPPPDGVFVVGLGPPAMQPPKRGVLRPI
jgi:hypothetical protein